MSGSLGRAIGSVIGGLAGPSGVIIGSVSGSILGEALGLDDSLSDAAGEIVGEKAQAWLGRLKPEDRQKINYDLQTAFRDALCEALHDIGGEICFPEAWKDTQRNVPIEVVYPKSAGAYLWHTKDPLADQLCSFLQQLEQAVMGWELLPLNPSISAASVERYLSADTPQELADEFFEQIMAPYLKKFDLLWKELKRRLFEFEKHLRQHLFKRLLVHLGSHLKSRTPAWRAFNRLMLEEVRLRVRQLGGGQADILKRLEQVGGLIGHSNGGSSLTDHLADLITATGRIESGLDEGFDTLLACLNEEHDEITTELRHIRNTLSQIMTSFGSLTIDRLVSERRDFYQHISLPPNYVVRTDFLAQVRASLLSDTRNLALTSAIQSKPNALHGMGGIGKSVMARAICEDAAIRATFHDGILWTTLGQTPNLESKLREWINVLGDVVSESAPTIDMLKVKLAKLLEKRACLLIVDDVWQRNHAKAFLVGGTTCRLLLTTRDAAIANDLSATILAIPPMTSDEAIKLLTDWGGSNLAQVPSDLKEQIVNRLGRLPLAVKLAGAQLRRKEPAKWLATFDIRRLKSRRIEDLHDSLTLTFKLSLDDLSEQERNLYLLLGIFKEDEATVLIAIERLWATVGHLDGDEITDLIDDFAARALLEVVPSHHSGAVVLHDLLRDFMRVELGDDRYTDTHRALLDAYRETQQGEGWPTAANDGYLYDHLGYHLVEAQLEKELRQLLLNFDWLQVQRAYDPPLHIYTQEVRQVLEIAEAQGKSALPDVLSFSLLHGTLVSRASTIPVTALKAMILKGEVDQALRYADLITDPNRQANSYVQIGIQLHEQHQFAKAREVLARAWTAAYDIAHQGRRVRTLSKVLRALNQIEDFQQAQKALEYLLSLTEAIREEPWRAIVLLQELFGQLNKAKQTWMLLHIQNASEHVKNERERIRILCLVVHSLTQMGENEQAHEVLSRTKAVVDQVEDMSWRAEGLSRIALCQAGLGESHQAYQTVNNLLAELSELENKSRYGFVLSIMLDVLEQLGVVGHTNQLLARILMIAKQIDHNGSTLRFVGLHVAKMGDLDHALLIAQDIKDESYRREVLVEVAESLIHSTKFEQVLSMTQDVSLEWALTEAMVQVGAFDRALKVAKSIEDEIMRVEALSTIALALAEMGAFDKSTQLLNEVLAIAEVSDDHQYHARGLSEVALALFQADESQEAKRLFERALMLAQHIRHEPYHVRVLIKISRLLAQVGDTSQASQLLSQALVIAEEAKANWGASLISDTAQALAEVGETERAQQVLTDVLELTKASQGGFDTARTLNTVARCLIYLEKKEQARAVLDQALVAADSTSSERNRPWALSEAAEVLIELGEHEQARQVANRALPMAKSVREDRAISHVASVLAQVGEIERALATIKHVESQNEAAVALRSVVCTLLEQGDIDRALAIADDMIDDIFGQRALTLCDIAQKLIKESKASQARQVLRRALISAENENMWTKDGWRPRALNSIAHNLTQVIQPNETEIVDWLITAFRLARHRGRTEVWSHIEAFARVLGQLGVIKDVWLNIQAVESLWNL